MALRCLLFSPDEGTANSICQVLAGLGVDGEYCSEAVAAAEKVTNHPFQIVIIDWDAQPEAGLLLTAARERKASERPLTLAIVSDDASVPKALQAGANSILRKPILVNQVRDTLTTARDLLRAKHESAAAASQAAAAGASAGTASVLPAATGSERTLRAGEFLQSSTPAPGGQFVTESDMPGPAEQPAGEIDPLKDLEPVAASVAESSRPAPPPLPDEPRGLEWYLKTRAGAVRPSPVPAPAPPRPDKPDLLGFDQTPSFSATAPQASARASSPQTEHEQDAEAKLFAHIAGEPIESGEQARPPFRLGKRAIIGALVLAGCAIVAAPQAPWHPQMKAFWARGQHSLHAWLNPQPVTTPQAPDSHENFGRAGDEYKLPVAETIPDATTDPSQIQVVPVIDPTAKKPNNAGANADPTAVPTDGSVTAPGDQASQAPAGQVQESKPTQSVPQTAQPASGTATGTTAPSSASTSAVPAAAEPLRSETPAVAAPPIAIPTPRAPAKTPQPRDVSAPAHVPSSLKSQMASMTPDAGGNKPIEAALPSIEPVVVPEAAERGLLADQPAIPYPPNAKGQQGTVVLQVLIGRDGTVQDAKFLQGSLAFARTAIDGVKQWKFKPYLMNGRPASVQTTMTMSFKPAL